MPQDCVVPAKLSKKTGPHGLGSRESIESDGLVVSLGRWAIVFAETLDPRPLPLGQANKTPKALRGIGFLPTPCPQGLRKRGP